MSRSDRLATSLDDSPLGQCFAVELVRQLVIPTFVLDAECRVIVWNQACEQLTGMTAAEVMGTRDHWRAFYTVPHPCLADLVIQQRMGEIAQHYDIREPLPFGALGAHVERWCVMPLRRIERFLAIDAGPIRGETGRVVAVVETLRDITDRKRAEIELRLTASVFEHSQEGILITDTAARILDVNTAFSRVTGYGREEVLGRTPALLQSGLQDATFYQEMWHRLRECGQWSGEVWNRRKSGEVFPEILRINAVKNANGEVSHYVGMFSDITDLKKTQRRLESLANYDALTGLPNRVLLGDRLHQALANAKRDERLVAICFLDLDDFKLINDRNGHAVGDRFLIEIARRLIRVVRGGDMVARLGGDEFVLLVTNLSTADELEVILERMLKTVSVPVEIDGVALGVSASLGITLFPFDDADPDTLLRHADQAMYQAKQQGRNRYQLFDMDAAVNLQLRHQELERIRQALQHGELQLYYQPKVNMRSARVVGAEALIRWQHPERGLVAPLEFLPLAEQSALIVDIGEWVLHEALGQLAQWLLQGYRMTVSVNISARHFQHIDFVPRLQAILSEHPGVPADHLELEILESVALDDVEAMRAVMAACQAIGVRFALDDFGTGYSSLSYLKQLPAETLKIDRSFVRDMLDDQEDLAIIEGVIGLARIFNKEVIAEGVETPEHGVMLMRIGCDCAQGYAIGRPMPADAVVDWLERFEPDPKWLLGGSHQIEQLDLPLLLAQYDHVKWVRQVVGSLDGKAAGALGAKELSDHCDCRFGLWLAGEGRDRYGHLPEYAEIDGIHAGMHRLAHEILRLRDTGQIDAARRMSKDLVADKRRILETLDRFQRALVRYQGA